MIQESKELEWKQENSVEYDEVFYNCGALFASILKDRYKDGKWWMTWGLWGKGLIMTRQLRV